MNTTADKLGIGHDEVGSLLGDQQALLDLLAGDQQTANSISVDQVEPATPFVVGTPRVKSGLLKYPIAFNVPKTLEQLDLIWIKTADRDTDAHFNDLQFSQEDVAFSDPSLGTITVDSPWLDANTTYDLLRTIGRGQLLGRVRNPTDPPARTDPPLAQIVAGAGANAPGKPSLARIIHNTIETTEDGLIPIVTVRVPADDAQTLTFAQQVTSAIQVKFQDVADTTIHPRRNVNIEDTSVTFIDMEVGDMFVLGRQYSWIHNGAWSGDELALAVPAAPVTFFAGGFADPSDLTNLTLVSYASEFTDDPNVLNIILTLHQPNPAFRLKNLTVKRKVAGNPDSDYDLDKNLVVGRDSLADPIYNVPGNIVYSFPMSVRPTKTYVIRTTVRVVGGTSKDFTSGSIAASSPTTLASTTAASGGPSIIDGGSFIASVKDYADLEAPPGAGGDAIYPGRLWQTASNSGVKINNTATGGGGATIDSVGLQWDNTNKRLKLATNVHTLGGKPATRIGKIFRPDDAAVICPLFQSATADVTIDISFALVDQTFGDVVVVTATGFVISHLVPTRYFGILIVPNAATYTGTDKQWIELRVGSNPSQIVYTWNWELDWDVVYRDFKPNANEQAVLNFLNATPTSAGSGSGNIITIGNDGSEFSRDGTRAGRIDLS